MNLFDAAVLVFDLSRAELVPVAMREMRRVDS